MNEIIFGNLGFGDPRKENLWNYCPKEERLEILRKLHIARSVIPVDLIRTSNPSLWKEWSELDFCHIPEEIQPFLFLAFSDNNFNSKNVLPQIERFS